ncbi:peritrophin-48-like, partial [Musca vetustissima]|uniref:peritrophin-48-like n=1 Tax=Musca vetustissima TaxID=27455 RepID=UPI002AB67BBC
MQFAKHLLIFASLLAMGHGLSLPQLRESITEIAQNVLTLCNGRHNDTRFADYNDCHKFYVCSNGIAHEYNCDEGYHFDKYTLSCMDGSDCQNKEFPDECVDGRVRAVEGDCFIYQSCVNGQYQNIKCRTGHYFDASKLSCRPITYNANYKCNCVVPDHTVMSNFENCETYYVCEDGEAVLNKCPLGEYYNATYNTCVEDLDGTCLMEPTKAPLRQQMEKFAKTAVENLCQNVAADEVAFYGSDSDCNQFLVCSIGQLFVKRCPQNFYFDANLKYCIFDGEHKCQENGQLVAAASNAEESQTIPVPK